MYELLSYIFIIILIILLIFYTYTKIKYGFWILQPVFHVYDFWYMIFPPGIIQHELPKENKYTNFKNIENILYNELSDFKLQNFIHFINLHYLQNKGNTFSPKMEHVTPYFAGHNDVSFVSFYTEKDFVTDLKKGTTVSDDKIIGVMTS